jgi:hypothetical protein
MNDKSFEPGTHTIEWHGDIGSGDPVVHAGIYYVTIHTGTENQTSKIILIK